MSITLHIIQGAKLLAFRFSGIAKITAGKPIFYKDFQLESQ